MSAPVLATKRCRTCDEVKPLSEFYKRKRGSRDGLDSQCKACARAYQAERNAKLREAMGDDYYRAYRLEIVNRHRRRTGNARGKQYESERRAAVRVLIERHQAEFDHLFLLARRGELDARSEAAAS